MASILQPPSRLIECPADLSGSRSLTLNSRQVVYFVIPAEHGETFIVVLGYFSGQVTDVVTKDLVERIDDSSRSVVADRIRALLNLKNARLFFL